MNIVLPQKQITRQRRSINIQIESRSELINSFLLFCKNIKILYNPQWRILKNKYSTDKYKIEGCEDFYYQPTYLYNRFNPFLIVKDTNNENRFLVLISYMLENHIFLIFGIIIYKDSLSSDYIFQNINILEKILLVADFREDFPNKKNVFFSNQSIMISLFNNNQDSYTINMIVINYEDKFICMSTYDSNLFNFNSKSLCNLLYNRWVKFESNPNSNGNIGITLINILSFEFKDNSVYFDIISFPNLYYFNEYFNENINNIIKENNKLFCDSLYPNIICIKCENILSSVNYIFDLVNKNGGNNVCINCNIRYSYIDGGWVCCKYLRSNSNFVLCNNKVDDNFECNNIHIVKYIFNFINKGIISKYPNFKKYDFCIECIE